MKDEIKEILDDLLFTTTLPNVSIKLSEEKLYQLKNYITNLQEENDYLKDIVSNTELSDEIKKADKWSKRELYKINYQRLQVNKRLREENERLNNIIKGIETYCNIAIGMNFNMNNSELQNQIVEDYTDVLDKLKELKSKGE